MLDVATEADLPTPTHRKPQSDPIHQSPVHENAYWEGVRGTLTSSADEDQVVVYSRESILWEGKEGGLKESMVGEIRATHRIQRAW